MSKIMLSACFCRSGSDLPLRPAYTSWTWAIFADLDRLLRIYNTYSKSLVASLYKPQTNTSIYKSKSADSMHRQILPVRMIYIGCNRRNVRDFRRVFLRSNYTDITQNTYIQSWTVTEIMAIVMCGLLGCRRTVRRPWCHAWPMRLPGNETW